MKTSPDCDRCGQCWSYLRTADKYCRRCGTKRGSGSFDPRNNLMQIIYGPPPVEFKFLCKSCGLEWTECLMVNFNKYCPKCGAADLQATDPYSRQQDTPDD